VNLLCGAFLNTFSVSDVCLEVDFGDNKKLAGETFYSGGKRELVEGGAIFDDISFDRGTRACPITIRFSVDLVCQKGGNSVTISLTSPASNPFIVTTHENQWASAEGSLLNESLFKGSFERCAWPKFVNVFKALYLRVTRQLVPDVALNPSNIVRPLSVDEICYIYERLGRKDSFYKDTWNEFWKKIEECLRKVRFSKHVTEMWISGLIVGFFTRDQAEVTLAADPEGTFLIRFSETSAGSWVISFVGSNSSGRCIKHYLVSILELNSKISLAEFIVHQRHLTQVVKVSVNPVSLRLKPVRVAKDDAFGKFIPKVSEITEVPNHYDTY